MARKNKRVLVIPDLQAPFQHRDSIKFLTEVAKDFGVTTPKGKLKEDAEIVCIGDEIDFHAISPNYLADPDADYTPKTETLHAIDFMKELYAVFPTVKAVTSNHTMRPWRKAFNAGLPTHFLKSYKEAFEAPEGWRWEDEWIIDNVKYLHGEELTGGRSCTYNGVLYHGMSLVHGHRHLDGGVVYIRTGPRLCFGMNVGCLIDESTYAFKYGKKKALHCTLGCGVVLGPDCGYFIPYS